MAVESYVLMEPGFSAVVSSSTSKGIMISESLEGTSDVSHLPLVNASTIPPTPTWALIVADHPGPVPATIPSWPPLQDSEKKRLAEILWHKHLSFDKKQTPPTASSSTSFPIVAKWEELLTLLDDGYGFLIADPAGERRARDLFQEACTVPNSLMQSPEFQERADRFMVDFVRALDIVRVNKDHLPIVDRALNYWHTVQLEITKRLGKLDSRCASYVSKEVALQSLQAERVELERRLAEVTTKEMAQRAEIEAMAPGIWQDMQQISNIEKEMSSSETQIKAQKQSQQEMMKENSQLDYDLKNFVQSARTLLYSDDE